jgi:DNA-binding transcriptional MocR family regulator
LKFIRLALASRRTVLLKAIHDQIERYAAPVTPYIPAGGFYIWLKLKSSVPDKIFVEAGIDQGILFYPGSIYGAEKGYFRLTFASIGETEIVEGIQRISNALKQL